MPAAATATVVAIGKARDRAKPGRDNSVSPYRHNLLTTVFYGSSYLPAGSALEANSNYFNYLTWNFKKLA
jgi:hypothetical protein